MINRPLLPVFAATLFLSAFLIFSVQPMVSKMLLPLLGGSPSIWNTAMVFFQSILLAGYAYAHFIARFLSLKSQAITHVALLFLFAFILPIALPENAAAPDRTGQSLWQLGTMLACVGGPFFVLAASAPLFQYWFASSGHRDSDSPYFLYAVSNAGSMISLLSYPLITEPLLALSAQTYIWALGYGLLIALTIACAYMVRNGTKPLPELGAARNNAVEWRTRIWWVFLAFIPSSLMLGVTTLITTDIASAPMLWVLPLALYLGTFIIAFARKPAIKMEASRELAAFSLCFSIMMFAISAFVVMKVVMILLHLTIFFLCALYCHSALVSAKPAPSRLTEFYLLMSFGGVLGGAFNALLAPALFIIPVEYALTLALVPLAIWLQTRGKPAISLRFNSIDDKNRPFKLRLVDLALLASGLGLCIAAQLLEKDSFQVIFVVAFTVCLFLMVPYRGIFAIVAAFALLTFQNGNWNLGQDIIERKRNYFGVVKITAKDDVHYFYHGTTLHGAQNQNEEYLKTPVTYYSPNGPASDLFNAVKTDAGQSHRIAGVGLGVGSIACYTAPGRIFDFYEIDADVVAAASDPRYFSYLSECAPEHTIILGDGRVKISEQPDDHYDMIFLDAFSSDNIPVHLVTKDALEIYLGKLKSHGFIGMNISNRYLDLRPMLTSLARDMGLTVAFKSHQPDKKKSPVSNLYTASVFAVIAETPENIAPLLTSGEWRPYIGGRTARAWTDDYANILGSLVKID